MSNEPSAQAAEPAKPAEAAADAAPAMPADAPAEMPADAAAPDEAATLAEAPAKAAAFAAPAVAEPAATAEPSEQPESPPATTAAADAIQAPRTLMPPEVVAAELKSRFPALFGGAPKPIKLRIQADIQARAPGVFTRQTLSVFLHRHTTSTNYLIALAQQPHRLDLDGQPAGEVSAEHRDAAAQEVERRRALRREREAQIKEQRRAERQAERERARELPRGSAGEPTHGPAGEPARVQRQRRPGPQRPPRLPHVQGAPAPQPVGARPVQPRPQPSRAERLAPQPPEPPTPPKPEPPLLTDAEREQEQARRERARLLRDFDSSPLTKSNFCVLKGIKPEALDGQLSLARQEAAAWAAAHPKPVRDERPPVPPGRDRPFDGPRGGPRPQALQRADTGPPGQPRRDDRNRPPHPARPPKAGTP